MGRRGWVGAMLLLARRRRTTLRLPKIEMFQAMSLGAVSRFCSDRHIEIKDSAKRRRFTLLGAVETGNPIILSNKKRKLKI